MAQILGQFCINVTDIERSIAFWDGVIGIPLQSRTEIPGVHEAVLQAPRADRGCNSRSGSNAKAPSTWAPRCGSST